jgi:hypothetical protein
MMQEHPQRLHDIKRASAHGGKNIQLDEPAYLEILNSPWYCCAAVY